MIWKIVRLVLWAAGAIWFINAAFPDLAGDLIEIGLVALAIVGMMSDPGPKRIL